MTGITKYTRASGHATRASDDRIQLSIVVTTRGIVNMDGIERPPALDLVKGSTEIILAPEGRPSGLAVLLA
jgi:hypothetical protein